MHTYTSLPQVTRHTAWGPNTEEDTKAYIEQVLVSQLEKPRQDYELAVCLKDTGILIGGVGIHVKDTNAEMGYILNPDYQGKGYATEAARALLGFGFSTLDVHRIYATCRPMRNITGHNFYFRREQHGSFCRIFSAY
ncbi:GNAT family N-acetyltransferase [Paenibacillus sp. ALE3]|uniref:GNAT family N-acetyltransferase n=1 Tax=unclassified Paenibacillus TaxID=185978 RepID=UPI00237B4B86|nr:MULTISPECIES: GNAT family N-acetyltransferase [unclassified Paenibacillus]